MKNPFAALVGAERKDGGGVWAGPLGSLIAAYVREGAGVPLVADQALRVAAVASCVGLISQNIAALPLHMYRRLERGKERIGRENALVRLLQRPNGWQTGQDWREQMTAHVLLRGNAFSWISWGPVAGRDGRVREGALALVPLHPDRVEVVGEFGGSEMLAGRRYFLHRRNGERVELPADEVFHLAGLGWDGVQGRSVLSDARDAIGVALSTQQFAARLFDNDATPGVVLKYPKTLTKDAADRLREQWDAEHRGAARRTAVLEDGMTLERLTLSAEDTQFLQTRQFQRSEIAGLFRVPPHLIGDVDRSTSWGTGIEQQQIAFLQFTLLPWLRKWESTIFRALIVNEADFFVEHAVEGFLRGDVTARGNFYAQMVELGVLTRNEVRELENRNPLEGLDEPLTPRAAAASAEVPE